MDHVVHEIEPVFDSNSSVLILGSFPSVKSREAQFYYGHPRNKFWKVLSGVFKDEEPITKEEKIDFLLRHRIALWDVIESCDIKGSSDSSITNVKVNDLKKIIEGSNIKRIFVNGDKAYRLYNKYQKDTTGIEAVKLSSTSPANAKMDIQSLILEWSQINK